MSYEQSETIAAFSTALAKAQLEITAVVKGSDNPFFDSRYADYAACWEAVHGPLNKNEISIFQGVSRDEHGLVLVTQLTHKSGEWMRHGIPLEVNGKNPMQALGSAITYARRYGLCAATGLGQKDDDGNSAHDGKDMGQAKTAAPKTKPEAPPIVSPAGTQLAEDGTLPVPMLGDDEHDWLGWATSMSRHIKSALKPDEVDPFIDRHRTPMAGLKKASLKAHTYIMDQADEARGRKAT